MNFQKRWLRIGKVLEKIPISKSAWWAGVAEGRFPAPTKLGPRLTVWLEEEIDEFMEGLKNEN